MWAGQPTTPSVAVDDYRRPVDGAATAHGRCPRRRRFRPVPHHTWISGDSPDRSIRCPKCPRRQSATWPLPAPAGLLPHAPISRSEGIIAVSALTSITPPNTAAHHPSARRPSPQKHHSLPPYSSSPPSNVHRNPPLRATPTTAAQGDRYLFAHLPRNAVASLSSANCSLPVCPVVVVPRREPHHRHRHVRRRRTARPSSRAEEGRWESP